MIRKILIVLMLLSVVRTTPANAQTSLNPDISAIGDFRVYGHNDAGRASESETLNLADPGLELVVGGYLNPYARADIVAAWEGDENAAIEEMYATFLRGLPLNLNVRVGKYRLEFGRLNPVHPHAYSFIFTPLPHEALFGEEGLNDIAIQSSVYIPTGNAFTEFKAALLKGNTLFGEEETTDEAETEDERVDLGVFGRLTSSFAVSETGELALGISALNSPYAEEHLSDTTTEPIGSPNQLRSTILGADLKYKNKPSRYRALQIEAEGLMRIDEQSAGLANTKSYGGYGYLDYRFAQRYNAGGILEWVRQKEVAESEETPGVMSFLEHNTWRTGLFVGFAPVEETSLIRLVGNWTKPENENENGFWELNLQLIISLGPHQPHNF
jgi:hypothetical protein